MRLQQLGLRARPIFSRRAPACSAMHTRGISSSSIGTLGPQYENQVVTFEDEEDLLVTSLAYPDSWQRQLLGLQDMAMMLRKPGILLTEKLKLIKDGNRRSQRHLVLGEPGTGKTMTLAHALHYAQGSGWIVMHIPSAEPWIFGSGDISESIYKPISYDQHFDALEVINVFNSFNPPELISKLRLSEPVILGPARDRFDEGTEITQLIDAAHREIKYATDVCGILVRELRRFKDPNHPVMFAIDDANALFKNPTEVFNFQLNKIPLQMLNLAKFFMRLLVYDVNNSVANGAVVVSFNASKKHLPQNGSFLKQMKQAGREQYDITRMKNYTPEEVASILRFYRYHGYTPFPDELSPADLARLRTLTDLNPAELANLVKVT